MWSWRLTVDFYGLLYNVLQFAVLFLVERLSRIDGPIEENLPTLTIIVSTFYFLVIFFDTLLLIHEIYSKITQSCLGEFSTDDHP